MKRSVEPHGELCDEPFQLGCCPFRGHPVKVEGETGGGLWERDGNSAGSSSLGL
jgi:hypothetical protein